MSEGKRLPPPQTDPEATFKQAVLLHRSGHAQQATRLCEAVCAAHPRHAAAWHMRGLIALNGANPDRGVEWIERSLELDANQPSAHANLGSFLLARNLPGLALEHLQRALRLKPDYPLALYNQGNALSALGRFEEALASYDGALRLQSHWTFLNNRGVALRSLGRLEEAAAAFEAAVCSDVHATDAHAIDAHNNLSASYLALERPQEALACSQSACRLAEANADCWLGLGNAWLALKHPDRAFDAYSAALRLRGDHVDALCGRCAASLALMRPAAALADAETARRLGPSSAALLNNLGNALALLDRNADSLSQYEEALKLDPVSTDAMYNRASMLRRLGRHEEAARACAQLLSTAPRHRHAFGLHFQLCMDLCDWREYPEGVSRLLDALGQHRDVVNPMTLLLLDSPQVQLSGAQRFTAEQAVPVRALPPPAFFESRDKIRLAYLSADFREHPVAELLVGVLEQHDRSRFDVLGVSFNATEDSALGRRIRGAFDAVLDVRDWSDSQVAASLRERKIDIAIDLMGFTQGQRIGILAHRAAPIQVAFLGFAGTSGLPCLDYLIADEVSLPQGLRPFFSERIVTLPQCLLPNDGQRAIGPAPPRSTLGLPEVGLVLCAFTNSCKINPPMFDIWMDILKECPTSVLWLRGAAPAAEANLKREAARRGVTSERLIFAARVASMAEHLARLSRADLFLDTMPYNAHSTACDALWAGVPVVTCKGQTFASRIAASALHDVGLTRLAADTPGRYREISMRLARQPDELREARECLAVARRGAPLFNAAAFARHLETAFETMQGRAFRGALPESFSVAADTVDRLTACNG